MQVIKERHTHRDRQMETDSQRSTNILTDMVTLLTCDQCYWVHRYNVMYAPLRPGGCFYSAHKCLLMVTNKLTAAASSSTGMQVLKIFLMMLVLTQIHRVKKRKEKGCTCSIMLVLQQVLFSFFFHLKVGGGINERREKKLPLRFEPVIAGLRVQIVKPWSYLRKKGALKQGHN